jgi:hypothetical protein
LDNESKDDKEVVMTRKIVFSVLALVFVTLPATAQNQWLTSFKDAFGDHIYYQEFSGGPSDVHQLWPTGSSDFDMNQLVSNGTYVYNSQAIYQSPLASFGNTRGQHLYYVGFSARGFRHVHHLFWNASTSVVLNEDLQELAGLSDYNDDPQPINSTITGFSNSRGEHVYYTNALDNHVHELQWFLLSEFDWDLTAQAKPSAACAYPTSQLTSFNDSQSVAELLYYIGPTNHLCELAWYQGGYSSYDLTALCGSLCPTGSLPMLNSPLTGFADAGGQHVLYLGKNQHVNQMLVSKYGLSNQDLTNRFGGPLAVADSLTSFSNASGPQAFYADIHQHVHQININNGPDRDLTGLFGGTPAMPRSVCGGTSLASISSDDKGSEDVFYIGADQHVYEIHFFGGPWANFNLTAMDGGKLAGIPAC